MKSALFGHNYVEDDTSAGSTGQVATKVFAPEVFAFTTISASKFGNKVRMISSFTLMYPFDSTDLIYVH